MRARCPRRDSAQAFTILEILVSFAVLTILVVILATMISRTSSVWSYARGQAEQFREAREAFDTLTRRLGESTLGTYLDYEDADGLTRTVTTSSSFVPKTYGRQSELRYLSGPDVAGEAHAVFFQCPLGRTSTASTSGGSRLLNTVGYFVEYGNDRAYLPTFLESKNRFRLMEFCEPADQLSVYAYTTGGASVADRTSRKWFTHPLNQSNRPVSIAAENILALILLPMLPATDLQTGGYTETSLAPNYLYDSTSRGTDPRLNPRNQLPPIVQVTMIAIDEVSASRLGDPGLDALRSEITTRFRNAEDYPTDLQSLRAKLTELGVNFRVFTSNVILKNAKWSREQKG